MKKYGGYDQAKEFKEQEKLPIGGYALKILNAEEKSYNWGNVLAVSFDIEEGDHKGFFKANYNSQSSEDKKWKGNINIILPKEDGSEKDEWTLRAFKTNIRAIEDSNSGYHWDWDEKKLKGKLVGGLFRNKEYSYNGHDGFFTECCQFTTVEKIRTGKFKIPADKLLKNKSNSSGNNNEFTPVEDDDELPF